MRTPTLCALAVLGVASASAQVPISPPAADLQTSGTAYFVFAEPGAPTMEVTVVGDQVRSGIYRLQEGTTLTDLIALSGGVPTSQESERQIVRAIIRVLRQRGGERATIYEATTEQAIRQPGSHPSFTDGDLVEMDIEYEEVRPPLRLIDIVSVASRVASLVTAAILIYTRVDNI